LHEQYWFGCSPCQFEIAFSNRRSVALSAISSFLAQRQDVIWVRVAIAIPGLLHPLVPGLASRQQLAKELGYTGALDGSAEMNIWLHKQVMAKFMEGGGKVPDSLKDGV